MLKDKEDNQAEELSQGLNILNNGRQPVVQDEEVKELIKLAAVVKQSYNQQEDLPKLLIAEMADNLAAELGEQKLKRRRYWLYGGFIGTAAAVFIAAFVQFLLPQTPNHIIAQQTEDSIETQKILATADQSVNSSIAASQKKENIPQPVEPDNHEKSPVSKATEEKSADSVPKVIAEIIQGTESPTIEEKSNQVAILQQDIPKDIAARKSVSMDETQIRSQREAKSIQPKGKIATMMVMPNQEAQSIKIDNARGVIQQVYNMGNNDEIIITQRLLDESQAKSKANVKQGEVEALADSAAVESLSKKAKEDTNSITVKVDRYDITIEGKKTSEELQKIAESLAAKEI